MKEGKFEWLIDALVIVRVVALALAGIAGAILERDVGVLPAGPGPLNSGSSFRSSVDREACPPLR